ncbi:MAG: IS1380 family transposase [bacterium]
MELEIEYTDKEITSWGGLALLQKMLKKMNFTKVLQEMDLPEQKSNRGYKPEEIITSFLTGVWCGATKYSDLEIIRGDKVIKEILGFKSICSQKSYIRYFSKFNEEDNINKFTKLYKWMFTNLKRNNYTLDIDSTVISRYGDQEGSKKGYQTFKKGRKSHHPIIAMVSEEKKVANFWLRSGDSYTSNNFIAFFENTIERLEGKTVSLLRADSGFFADKILNYLEDKETPVKYIISAKLYKTIKKLIIMESKFHTIAKGIQIAEVNHNLLQWQKPRRFIIIRQNIAVRPKATGKEISQTLFPEIMIDEKYRYGVLVTNLDLSPELVWHLYKERANCENIIKELKYDFAAGSFNLQSFTATEAALNFIMIGYNLMSLFKDIVLKMERVPMMKFVRYKVLSMGAMIIRRGRKKILQLAIQSKRRRWFQALWNTEYSFCDWHL